MNVMRSTKSSLINSLNIFFIVLTLITVNMMRVIEPIGSSRFNIALSDFIVPIVVIIIFLKLIHGDKSFKIIHGIWSLALIAWLIISNQLAEHRLGLLVAEPSAIYGEWLKTVVCLAYFYIGYLFLHNMQMKWLLRVYVVGFMLFLIYGFGMLVALSYGLDFQWFHENAGRYFLGTYHDPNHAATYISLSFFILMYTFNYEEVIVYKIITIIVAVMSVPALILTDSRGGLLAFACALIVYVVVMYYKSLSGLVSLILLLLISLLFGLLFDSMVNDGQFVGNLISSFINFGQGLDIRNGLRLTAWQMGRDYWLTGVGRANFLMNSSEYFEALDLTFIDEIPHNTYVGLFAETGIIGVILYSMPLVWILSQFYKRRKQIYDKWGHYQPFIAMVIGVLITLGAQAYTLNIENRRTYWLLAGVLLWYMENRFETLLLKKAPGKSSKVLFSGLNRHGVINICLAVACLGIFLYSVNHVHIPKKDLWLTSNQSMTVSIPEEMNGQPMELEYYVYAYHGGLSEQDTLQVSIIESLSGGDKILSTYTYPRTRGTCRMTFIPSSEATEVRIEVEKISNELRYYKFRLERLISVAHTIDLTNNYYLASEEKQAELIGRSVTARDDERYVQKIYKPKLSEFDSVIMSDLLMIEGMKIDATSDGLMLVATYIALEDIEHDYTIYMYANPDNLHNLDRSRFLANNEYYVSIEPIKTSEWHQGERYEVKYMLPRNYGWHRLVGGIYHKDGDKINRLIDEETGRNYVIFGWVDFGAF